MTEKITFAVYQTTCYHIEIDREDLGDDPTRWEAEAEEYFIDTPERLRDERESEIEEVTKL